MSKTRVTYIISGINKAVAFEWIAELLDKEKFELKFILLNAGESLLENYLKEHDIPVQRITYKNKFYLPLAVMRILFALLKHRPNVIHTHLFDAGLSGLLAGWICGIKKRIYTRHHSTYHHQYFPKAVKYDKLCNYLATHIVSVSQAVSRVLIEQEAVPATKLVLIHHGFKLQLFEKVSDSEIKNLRQKYTIDQHRPVVGVIARYTIWKGIQYILPAFKKLLNDYPQAVLLLANAGGDYESEIKKMLNELPAENFREITFEPNLFALYKLFDVFVHVPVDSNSEAFGQVYVEALAASVPSVFTLSGIANDFIKHGENARVVNYCDSQSIYSAIKETLANPKLTQHLSEKALQDVNILFPVSKMITELEQLYLN